ncbi:MAG: hypothetical protein IKV98_06865 [Clostridia bacterium]|nr:hypothetical protein [Clostridia bacterium]
MTRYEAPEFELVVFETEDVVTAEGSANYGDNDFDVGNAYWNDNNYNVGDSDWN